MRRAARGEPKEARLMVATARHRRAARARGQRLAWRGVCGLAWRLCASGMVGMMAPRAWGVWDGWRACRMKDGRHVSGEKPSCSPLDVEGCVARRRSSRRRAFFPLVEGGFRLGDVATSCRGEGAESSLSVGAIMRKVANVTPAKTSTARRPGTHAGEGGVHGRQHAKGCCARVRAKKRAPMCGGGRGGPVRSSAVRARGTIRVVNTTASIAEMAPVATKASDPRPLGLGSSALGGGEAGRRGGTATSSMRGEAGESRRHVDPTSVTASLAAVESSGSTPSRIVTLARAVAARGGATAPTATGRAAAGQA